MLIISSLCLSLSLSLVRAAPDSENTTDNLSNTEGFKWRGGSERQTTGIWMWSEPFVRKVSGCAEVRPGDSAREERRG